jgi:hypothetical protein
MSWSGAWCRRDLARQCLAEGRRTTPSTLPFWLAYQQLRGTLEEAARAMTIFEGNVAG